MRNFFLSFVFLLNYTFSQTAKTYDINGTERKTITYKPTIKTDKYPVVFVFHGRGGNAKFAAKKMNFQNYYKEAYVVFMEGIPGTSGYVIDKRGLLNGWQMFPGENGNRDVIFFDEVLKDLEKNEKIDDSRIYLVGHSNGARFVNVLWVERPNKISAICSVAAQGGNMIRNAKPISIWMSMGENDSLVSYHNQKKSIPVVKNNLKVIGNYEIKNGNITSFKGINDTELILVVRNEGHEFPQESIIEMVGFLKRNVKN